MESILDHPQIKQAIQRAMQVAKLTGLETGFAICRRDDRLEPDPIQVGTPTSVCIPPCERGKTVALFHTHLTGSLEPTKCDMAAAAMAMLEQRLSEFQICIGDPESGRVSCRRISGSIQAESS